MKVCLILNGYLDRVVGMWRLKMLGFCLWGRMKSEVHRTREVDKGGELLARILSAATCMKKREDLLRRKTRHFHTQVAKMTEAYGGIFRHLL
jgi:hypothetical protein